MKIFHYDPATGFLCSEGLADPSPLEPGCWLVPAYATPFMPPDVDNGFVAAFIDGEWAVVSAPPAISAAQPAGGEPVLLTPEQKLANAGLTVDELKSLLGMS